MSPPPNNAGPRVPEKHLAAIRHVALVDVAASMSPVWVAILVLNVLLQRGLPFKTLIGDGVLYIYSAVVLASAVFALNESGQLPKRDPGVRFLRDFGIVIYTVAVSAYVTSLTVANVAGGTSSIPPNVLVISSLALLLVSLVHSYFTQASIYTVHPTPVEAIHQQSHDLGKDFDKLEER